MSPALDVQLTPAARPPFKWAGGKRALAPEILARFPESFRTYHEPFLGAGAVFVALVQKLAAADLSRLPIVLSDANANVAATWAEIRDDVEGLIGKLRGSIHQTNSPDAFAFVRTRNMADPYWCAADFLYLNRFGFNGLYRVNKSGQFNVPFGDNPKAAIDVDNLRAVSRLLEGVLIRRQDFAIACLDAAPGDVVYLDPPYVPKSKTSSFSAYEAGGFSASDHERLRDAFAGMVSRGVHAVLSNSDTPLVRDLYARWRIVEVQARRSINSVAGGRGAVTELLVLPEEA